MVSGGLKSRMGCGFNILRRHVQTEYAQRSGHCAQDDSKLYAPQHCSPCAARQRPPGCAARGRCGGPATAAMNIYARKALGRHRRRVLKLQLSCSMSSRAQAYPHPRALGTQDGCFDGLVRSKSEQIAPSAPRLPGRRRHRGSGRQARTTGAAHPESPPAAPGSTAPPAEHLPKRLGIQLHADVR
jgi:hypothetical protein